MSGTNWSSGYVTEVTYTHGYYAELNPFRSTTHCCIQGLPRRK